MAPFRASRATRSGRPGGPVDENVFLDGLPVRQWRQQETTVGAPTDPYGIGAPGANGGGAGLSAWPQYGMPKGSEMYTSWHQQLLRGMRNGHLPQLAWEASKNGIGAPAGSNKVTRTEEERHSEEQESSAAEGATKSGSRNTALSEQGFLARRWVQVARDMEEPEREYLAKKRKGVDATYGTGVNGVSVPITSTGPMRKTKVRKLDAEGNPTVFEVLVPEGQNVEGEITESVTLENAAAAIVTPAPGTYVEGVGVANEDGVVVASEAAAAPIRRKPPPPRRKPKRGPGRGHKKIMPGPENATMGTDDKAAFGSEGTAGVKREGEDGEQPEDGEDEDDDEEDAEEGDYDDGEDMDTSEDTPPPKLKYSETPEPPLPVRETLGEHPLRQVETIDNDDTGMDIDRVHEEAEENVLPPAEDVMALQTSDITGLCTEGLPTSPVLRSPLEHTLVQPAHSPVTETAQLAAVSPPQIEQEQREQQVQQQQEPMLVSPQKQHQQSPIRPELEPFTPPTPPAPAYEPLSQVSAFDLEESNQPKITSETGEGFTAQRHDPDIEASTISAAGSSAKPEVTSTNAPAVEPHGIVLDPQHSDENRESDPDFNPPVPPLEAQNTPSQSEAMKVLPGLGTLQPSENQRSDVGQ